MIVISGGFQRVNFGGSVLDMVISVGGGQSFQGWVVNIMLNGGEQWMYEGVIVIGIVINDKGWQVVKFGIVVMDIVVNIGVEGGLDVENGDIGQFVCGDVVCIIINKNGCQIVRVEGMVNIIVVYVGGDQIVYGYVLDIMLNGGYQYVYNGGIVFDIVVNSDGWQIVKNGGVVGNIIVNQKGRLQVDVGGIVMNVILKQGGVLVISMVVIVIGINCLGVFFVVEGKVDNVVLENGGCLDVLIGYIVINICVDDGGMLDVCNGGIVIIVFMGNGGVLLVDFGVVVSGIWSDGKVFSIGGGQVDVLMLEKGSLFMLNVGDMVMDIMVNGGLFIVRGGILVGIIMLNNGVIFIFFGKMVNNDILIICEGDVFLQGGFFIGNGSVEKLGSGIFIVSNIIFIQKVVNLNEGMLMLNDSIVIMDVIVQCGIVLKLIGSIVLNGVIDFMNVIFVFGVIWNIFDNVMVQLVVDDFSYVGQIYFIFICIGKFVLVILKVKNLNGQNGIISLCVCLDMVQNNVDRLVIDGGRVIGKIILNLVNVGNSVLGLVISGKGIQVVEVINGVIMEEGVFVQGNRLQVGVFNYFFNWDSDESWYLCSENVYCVEVFLYVFMLIQVMDYDWIVVGFCSYQIGVNGENNSVCFSIQGGYFGYDNNGGIVCGVMLESSGSYGFVCLEGDLMRIEVVGMFVIVGVYGVVGYFFVDVKDDDGFCVGMVWDDVGSLGGYLNLVYTFFGLWVDIVVQGIRYSMKVLLDNNDFCVWGWGWLGLLEIGLFFSIIDNLMLEL